MSDPMRSLQALLQPAEGRLSSFPSNSRYFTVETASVDLDGQVVIYLKRRFVPPPESMNALQEHSVESGDRLDKLGHLFYGDAELYWRICDGNGAMQPQDLTETVGRRLRITLPAGLPGVTGD